VSVDIDRGIMMVNWMRLPSRVELIMRAEARERDFRLFDGKQDFPAEVRQHR
jgi:quinoprotein glucose dehydrogenase